MKKDKDLWLKKAIIEGNKEIMRKYKPMDKYEEELFEMWKNEKPEDIEIRDDLSAVFDKMQKEFIKKEAKKEAKDDVLTLRVKHSIKEKVKEVAAEIGLSYQSYINMVLYQIATGKIVNKTKVYG